MSVEIAPIGVFDSGSGGLTVLRALAGAMPQQPFIYLGDHAHLPYGERQALDIKMLTARAVEALFQHGCRLVVLACNTASAVALRWLQQVWLPQSEYAGQGYNVLGVIIPLVEAVTGQNDAANGQTTLLFATPRTIQSGVFEIELKKYAPHINLIANAIPALVPAIESGAGPAEITEIVYAAIAAAVAQAPQPARAALLGCTHYPLALGDFRAALPAACTIYDQPAIIAQRLSIYLKKHLKYLASSSSRNSAGGIQTGMAADRLDPQSDALRMTTDLYRATDALEKSFGDHAQLYSTKPWEQTRWLLDYLQVLT